MSSHRSMLACLVPLLMLPAVSTRAAGTVTGPRIEIGFSHAAHAAPITGRVYVAISRTDKRPPIDQTSATGEPLFGHDVTQLGPGQTAVIDASDFGAPVKSLADLPAGTYWMQAFVNIYTRFQRADGHTVWLHMDHWEGQNWRHSPGNLYGTPVKVHFDPHAHTSIKLVADHVIPPVTIPPDTKYVKRFRIRSAILSRWWGHPIHLGATVLLPRGYASHPHTHYPVIYDEGHFSLSAPMGFGDPHSAFRRYWLADGTPRMIIVKLQHPSPYYDDSYGVNSANDGPYGTAIQKELVPAVESRFRVIRQPWARLLTGESTGGWIALATQIFHPAFYGGTFAECPDPVDFRYYELVDIYRDQNAYWVNYDWDRVPRPASRKPDGSIMSTVAQENHWELAEGTHGRSGDQWDIWQAVFGPVGPDGYPKPIWNQRSGVIDHAVAAYWKRHYDLRYILQTHWATLGPLLTDKLHIYVGAADTFYLDMGVHMMDDFLRRARDPAFHGSITYQPMAPHCWGPRGGKLIGRMTGYLDAHAPSGADLHDWRY